MPEFKRRIRIEGAYDRLEGYMLRVMDAATGEPIPNIERIEMVLDAREANTARVHFIERDEATGKLMRGQDGEPVRTTAMVYNPDVSLTAYEQDAEEKGK